MLPLLLLLLLPLGFLLGWLVGFRRGVRHVTSLYLRSLVMVRSMLDDKRSKAARTFVNDILQLHEEYGSLPQEEAKQEA